MALLVLTGLVILLYRQFGLIYMRGGRHADLQGLDVGTLAPAVTVLTAAGHRRRETWAADSQSDRSVATAALFALPSCPICKSLTPRVEAVADRWPEVRFVWVDREMPAASDDEAPAFLGNWDVALSESDGPHKAFEINALPFLYIIDSDGVIRGKKLVNAVDDIDRALDTSLDVAKRDSRVDQPLVATGGRDD